MKGNPLTLLCDHWCFFPAFFPRSCCLIWKQLSKLQWKKRTTFALSNGISLVWWDLCQLKGHALILRSNTGYILIFSHFFVCLHCENIRPDNSFPNGAVIYMTWTLIKIQYGHWLPLCRGPLFCERFIWNTFNLSNCAMRSEWLLCRLIVTLHWFC